MRISNFPHRTCRFPLATPHSSTMLLWLLQHAAASSLLGLGKITAARSIGGDDQLSVGRAPWTALDRLARAPFS